MSPQALFGWGVLAITLAIFADIDSTSELAVAFAWLILFAVILNAAPQLFANISTIAGSKAA